MVPDKSILAGLESNSPDTSVTVDDVSDKSLFMAPGEAEVFDFYQRQNQGATGELSLNTYYPDAGHNVGVGGYSGSEIGSTTLFAPGGGLFPVGIMDARDKALQQAAAAKAKEVDDFRKQFKAPTSKLTNINENLTNEYIDHIQGGWQRALKKSGGDPATAKAMLQNDPEFWKKEKAFKDMAKMGDDIAAKTAQDDQDIRTGRFTPTPRYKELQGSLYKAIDPSNPEFKNLGNIYRTMQVERDFSDAFDDVTKRMVAEQKGYAWDNTTKNNPEFLQEWQKTVKEWSPEQKEGVSKTLQESFFPDSEYWTPEKIKKNVDYRMRGSQVDKKLNTTERRDDGLEKYTVNDVSEEKTSINGRVLQTGGTTREAKYPTQDGLTFKKPVGIILPVGTKAVDLSAGGVRNMDVGNVNAKLGGVFNAFTLNRNDPTFGGMMMDEDNAKKFPDAKVVTPMVSVTYTKKNEEGDPEEISTFVPLASVKNAIVNKGNKEAIEEIERRAAEANAKKPAPVKKDDKTPEKKTDINALRKKYNY